VACELSTRATGTFTIEAWEPDEAVGEDGLELGAVRLAKRFQGDLVGTGRVRMASGAIGGEPTIYVALELIKGTLLGRTGAFLLRHLGVMRDGLGTRDCVVVAGSGTQELTGLAGTFSIDVVDGVHTWSLDHTLD